MGRTRRIRKKNREKGTAGTCDYIEQDSFHQRSVEKYSQLMKWMVGNGFKGSFLQVAEFPGIGRGLRATADIKPGDILVSIPQELLITVSKVLKSELGPIIKGQNCSMTPQQILSVFLLFEDAKGTSSFWYPYLKILPTIFNTPAFYSEEELQLLPKGMYILAKEQSGKILSAYKDLYSFYEVLKAKYPELIISDHLSYERFQWAWYAVNTRCVYMEQPEKEHGNFVMAPFLDLLNHSPTVQTEAVFDPYINCYNIKTETHFKRWQQVFICYGSLGNDKLLLDYGFVVSNNQHSTVTFDTDDIVHCFDEIQDCEAESLHNKKLQIIQSKSLQSNLFCGVDGLSWCLSTALKIMCMDSDEIKTWSSVYLSSGISTSCEKRAIDLTVKLLKRELNCNQITLKKIEEATVQLKTAVHLNIIQRFTQERLQIIEHALREFIMT